MRTRTSLGGTIIVVAVAATLGGCQENLKEDNARLMQENLELREELAESRTEVREAQARSQLSAASVRTTPTARPEETIEMPDLSERSDTSGSANSTSSTATVTPQRPAAPSNAVRTHTIEKGDSLYRLAQRFYGSGLKWTLLYEANRDVIGPDFNKLVVGKTITIPPLVSND